MDLCELKDNQAYVVNLRPERITQWGFIKEKSILINMTFYCIIKMFIIYAHVLSVIQCIYNFKKEDYGIYAGLSNSFEL